MLGFASHWLEAPPWVLNKSRGRLFPMQAPVQDGSVSPSAVSLTPRKTGPLLPQSWPASKCMMSCSRSHSPHLQTHSVLGTDCAGPLGQRSYSMGLNMITVPFHS